MTASNSNDIFLKSHVSPTCLPRIWVSISRALVGFLVFQIQWQYDPLLCTDNQCNLILAMTWDMALPTHYESCCWHLVSWGDPNHIIWLSSDDHHIVICWSSHMNTCQTWEAQRWADPTCGLFASSSNHAPESSSASESESETESEIKSEIKSEN